MKKFLCILALLLIVGLCFVPSANAQCYSSSYSGGYSGSYSSAYYYPRYYSSYPSYSTYSSSCYTPSSIVYYQPVYQPAKLIVPADDVTTAAIQAAVREHLIKEQVKAALAVAPVQAQITAPAPIVVQQQQAPGLSAEEVAKLRVLLQAVDAKKVEAPSGGYK
jgi:hypothetical protein